MIGTWNIRTLSDPSKLAQVAKEMDKYNLDILGLAETRWIGSGEEKLQNGHHFMYSGNNTNK
ncbi:hypothetical protein PSTG_19194, partial [Puccinia striiformis f. sp. tritici PST-78]